MAKFKVTIEKTKKPPKTNKTLVTFLLDRTGSMSICRDSTIESFNTYLGELQKAPDGINFTFLQFDSESLDKIYVAHPIKDVRLLTHETYVPRANTPLIDAAYKTIKAVEAAVDNKTKVVVCIQTDGEENASVEYSWEQLHTLISEKTKLGWQFNFMGAGIDAYKQGARMGIAAVNTVSYDHRDRVATRQTFAATGQNTSSFAAGISTNTAYSPGQRAAAKDAFVPLDLTTLNLTQPHAPGKADAKKKSVPDITL